MEKPKIFQLLIPWWKWRSLNSDFEEFVEPRVVFQQNVEILILEEWGQLTYHSLEADWVQ